MEDFISNKICQPKDRIPKSDITMCTGQGTCLEQTGIFQENGEEVYSRNCIHECMPVKCLCYHHCHNVEPQWVLDSHHGFCMNCSTSLYNLYKKDYRDCIFKDWRKK